MAHYYEEARRTGSCSELKGLVSLIFLFVHEQGAVWTEAEMQTQRAERQRILTGLAKEAEKENVRLVFDQREYSAFASKFYKVYNKKAAPGERIDPSGNLSAANQTAFLFLFKKPGRSFACPVRGFFSRRCESLMLFGTDYHAMLHELLHLFGAADLYYPAEVKQLAEKLFPDSVMLKGGSWEIDELTRYLIGWHRSPGTKAKRLLDSTSKLKASDFKKALDRQLFNGDGVLEFSTGVYRGGIKNGLMDGSGTFTFKDGAVFTGECRNGKFNGRGSLRYPNGTVYTGEFRDGRFNGKGRMRYSNGKVFEGYFKDNKPVK